MDTNEFERELMRLKKKNWDRMLSDFTENCVEQEKRIIKIDALLDGIKMSEEEIDKLARKENFLNDQVMQGFNDMFNPACRADHKAIYHGIDLFPYIKKMQGYAEERLMIISIKNGEVIHISEPPVTNASSIQVGIETTYEALKDTIKCGTPGIEVIRVHNHPLAGCAFPSTGDNSTAYKWLISFGSMGIRFVDDIIVTPIDIYSQAQHELSHPEDRIRIFSDQLSDEIWKEIKEYNKAVYFALK